MFGYIKLDGYAPVQYRDYFKRNYCFLCRALDKHYGLFARLFVSYDVTFFNVLFSPENYLSKIKKISCYSSTKQLKEKLLDEYSKKVAALNLALAAGELKDNIDDKDKFYAKIAYKLYSGVFKKVRRDYPLLWEIIEEGHAKMSEVEKRNGSIEEIENHFANLIGRIAKEVFLVDDADKVKIIQYIAKMLYFMDAVDDIDKDIKRNTYNSLKVYKCKKEYVLKHYDKLREHLKYLRNELPSCEGDSLNAKVVNRILDFGIPETLVKVCFRGIEI